MAYVSLISDWLSHIIIIWEPVPSSRSYYYYPLWALSILYWMVEIYGLNLLRTRVGVILLWPWHVVNKMKWSSLLEWKYDQLSYYDIFPKVGFNNCEPKVAIVYLVVESMEILRWCRYWFELLMIKAMYNNEEHGGNYLVKWVE